MKFSLYNSRFFRFFSRGAELMLLNFLFILCCLPIFTAGASLSALYSVCLKLVRNEEAYIARDFFRAFRQNLKHGIILHLILLTATTVILTDLVVVWNLMETNTLLKGVFLVMALLSLLLLMASVYIYPLLAQFTNNVKGYLRNSAIMSVRHLSTTVMFLLINLLPFVAAMLFPAALLWEILLFLLLGFAGMIYVHSYFLSPIFNKYIEEMQE